MPINLKQIIILASLFALTACGGSSGTPDSFDGPILDISELQAMVVDQAFFSDASDDEFGSAEFSIYIKDVDSDEVIACAGGDDFGRVSSTDVYYGGVNAPMQMVTDASDEFPGANLQVIFVEKDSDACPEPMDDEDDIIGVSDTVNVTNILDEDIIATNGRARVMFKIEGTENGSVSAMIPTSDSTLVIDQVYVEGGDSEEAMNYFIYAEIMQGDDPIDQCRIEDPELPMAYSELLYAGLNLTFGCLPSSDTDVLDKYVRISVWRSEEGASFEPMAYLPIAQVKELVGEKVNFEEENGFIRFRNIQTTPFAGVRTSMRELEQLQVSSVRIAPDLSANPMVEVMVIADEGYPVACASVEDVVASDVLYVGVDEALHAIDGLWDLFGWSSVSIAVVERKGESICPAILEAADEIIAQTDAIDVDDIKDTEHTFTTGGGSVTLTEIN